MRAHHLLAAIVAVTTGCGRFDFTECVTCTTDDLLLVVEPRYAAAPGYTDWLDAHSDAPCSGDDTVEGRRACIHAGPLRRAVMPGATCDGVIAYDALNVLAWSCREVGGDAELYTTGLRDGITVRDLLDAAGWRANHLELERDGAVVARSEDSAFWPNPVISLDGVADGALGDAGTIYTLGVDRALPTLKLTGERSALVTLGAARLGPASTQAACTRASAGDATCVVEIDPAARFALVVADLDGALGYGVLAREPRFVTVAQTQITGASYGVALIGGTASAVTASVVDGTSIGVDIESGAHHVVDGLRARVSGNGVRVVGGMQHDVRRVAVTGGTEGILVLDSPEVRLHDVETANTASNGIRVTGMSPRAILTDVVAANSGLIGINIDGMAHEPILVGALAANSSDEGVMLWGVTRATATHVTSLANEQFGLSTYLGAHYASVSQLNVVNNGYYGLFVRGSSYGIYSQIATSNNTNTEVRVYQNSDFNVFTHALAGGPRTLCLVDGGGVDNNSVVTDVTGTPCGGDDATLDFRATASLTQAGQFTGLVVTDATNAHAGALAGMQSLDATQITDWTAFDHRFRFWGTGNTTTLLDNTNQRNCLSPEPCRAWDVRLLGGPFFNTSGTGRTANEPFVDGMPCPAAVHGDQTTHNLRGTELAGDGIGDDDGTCEAFEKCSYQSIFLVNARELLEDAVGDEDGLCESNETCVYSPNFGYYQGLGDPNAGPRCNFVDGSGPFAVTGVTMRAHPQP